MSGHSKWSTIKRKKAAIDGKRSAIFTKMIREITVAAKEGGIIIESNPRLKMAVQIAKKANMPKEVLERAINKGNAADGANYEEITYEGYAGHGVALIIECTTDNINRTVANLRANFNKLGGSMGITGSVSYMFDRKGVFSIPESELKSLDADTFALEVIDAGADDINTEDEGYLTVTCPFEAFGAVNAKLDELKIEADESKIEYLPQTTVSLDWDAAQKVLRLIDRIEEDDDVQNVYHNLELTDEVMAQMSA